MAVRSTQVSSIGQISANDRFSFTMFLSVVINAVIILGIGFSPLDDVFDNMMPTLDITLVPTRSTEEPDQADYFAQSNQIGGGDSEEKVKPETPSPAMTSTSDSSGAPFLLQPLEKQPKPKNTQEEMLTTQQSDFSVVNKPDEPEEMPEVKTPVAAELIARSQEISRLSADLGEQLQTYSKRPRIKYLSAAHTKEYKYATYIADWQRKVEKIGRLNFPDEAKRRNLQGDLLLDVALYANGTIAEVNMRRSSGHKILDDAAIAIVRLASPYQAFPPEIQSETDVLHITRTWQFLPGGKLVTR